jgi:WD40 repeat protein
MPAKQSLSFALEPRVSLPFDDYVADCAWAPDGAQLAVAGGEGKVALLGLHAATPTLGDIGTHLLGTLAIAWQPRARRFATAGQDGAVALWDAEEARELKRWKPATAATQALQ